MNYKIFLFAFLIFAINRECLGDGGYLKKLYALAQPGAGSAVDIAPYSDSIVDEDNESRLYVASFLRFNGSHIWISCAGTFIRDDFIVTSADCVKKAAGGESERLHIRSGVAHLWLAQPETHYSEEVTIHPLYGKDHPNSYNIAMVKVRAVGILREPLKPRLLDHITGNRYCTLMGWEGYETDQSQPVPLRSFPVFTSGSNGCDDNAPEAYCSTSGQNLTSSFAQCGGLLGAPVFCAGGPLSGIIVNDNLCLGSNQTPRLSFISVNDYRTWIGSVMNPPQETTSWGIDLRISVALLVSALAALKVSG